MYILTCVTIYKVGTLTYLKKCQPDYHGKPRVLLERTSLHQACLSLKTRSHFKHVYCHIGEAVQGGGQMRLAV